ncbi:MAG TPA: efflux RND transporter periplasmic adaptor subunit [Candidatus Dormibacteraeota bacterium]|nr:efflux RND transporter periplasmic adaptor subunit [Candidatus Dormibacteraeota bacterium]
MTTDHEDRLRADLQSLRIERAPLKRGGARGPRRRWLLPAVVVVLAVLGAAIVVARSRPLPVTVAMAQQSTAGATGPAPLLSGSGYVVTGDRYVSIGVRVPGRIDRYFVEEGQSVHKGDPLVQLDDRDYKAAVAAIQARQASARADLALADADLQRGKALRAQGVISQQELDVLVNRAAVTRAQIGQLDAELNQAAVNLDYTTLRAPADGVILAKLKEVGEIAVPGGFAGSGDLIRMANLTDMRAEVDVNEADLARVKIGQPAQVTPDAYPDAKYDARVVKLYPQVDRQKGTLKVEVHILEPDGKLLPDMSARVTFLQPPEAVHGDEAVVLVPAGALHRTTAGDTAVWVVRDGRVASRVVETRGDVGTQVRIGSGLQGGETVVVGDVPLSEGQRVVAQ